jgi:iron-sulfur cluster repair protein YtfE (RIC family)
MSKCTETSGKKGPAMSKKKIGDNIFAFDSPEMKTHASRSTTVGMKTSDGEKVEKKLSSLHPDLQEYISKETMVLSSMVHKAFESTDKFPSIIMKSKPQTKNEVLQAIKNLKSPVAYFCTLGICNAKEAKLRIVEYAKATDKMLMPDSNN